MNRYQQLDVEVQKLSNIARAMKIRGIAIDQDARAAHHARLTVSAEWARRDFIDNAEVSKNFNPASPPQLRKLVFEYWGVQPQHYTPTGEPSLEKEDLQDIIADFSVATTRGEMERASIAARGGAEDSGGVERRLMAARALLRYREETKYDSTYVGQGFVGEPGHYGLEVHRKTGAYHPDWNVAAAKTLRWTSPAQQIPKPVTNAKGEVIRPGLRNMFCARPGMWLVEADFSALEARFFALYAGIGSMIQAIKTGRKEDATDIHSLNARAMFGIEKPSGMQRDLAKILLFGCVMYAGAVETAYDQIRRKFPSLTLAAVERAVANFMKACPEIVEYRREQTEMAGRRGYTDIPFTGSRLYWKYGRLGHEAFGEAKLTELLNTRIQRSGAELINSAMIDVAEDINVARGWGAHILMQVHDALIVETSDPWAAGRVLKTRMEREIEYRGQTMPLTVEIKYGKNLQDMQELKL